LRIDAPAQSKCRFIYTDHHCAVAGLFMIGHQTPPANEGVVACLSPSAQIRFQGEADVHCRQDQLNQSKMNHLRHSMRYAQSATPPFRSCHGPDRRQAEEDISHDLEPRHRVGRVGDDKQHLTVSVRFRNY